MSSAALTFHLVSSGHKYSFTGTNVPHSYIEELPGGYLRPSSSGSPSPQLLGACTGLIAASAIASAGSLTTLLPLAVEAVRVAFRIGSYVGDIAQRVGGPHDVLESWSTIVAVSDKKAAEIALDDYNKEYVSGVTLSFRSFQLTLNF